MEKLNIGIIGAGGWAIALAIVLTDNQHEVSVWSAVREELEEIKKNRTRPAVLPDITIPDEIKIIDDLSDMRECDIIVLATASKFINSTAALLKSIVTKDTILVNVAKGLEAGTHLRLSQVISRECPGNRIVVLSGPSHAEEVARRIPTTVVSASYDKEAAKLIQDVFSNRNMRVYLSDDVVGVELGGAIKNVIAVASGIIEGFGLGDNTKAALMTRGITEMARLGEAMGGKAQTFAGLSGIGDLVVTCTSMHSRNHRAGILIGKGDTAEEAVKKIGMTVEGILAARAVHELALEHNVEMPIVKEVYNVLYEGKSVKDAIYDLMARDKKNENEDAWF